MAGNFEPIRPIFPCYGTSTFQQSANKLFSLGHPKLHQFNDWIVTPREDGHSGHRSRRTRFDIQACMMPQNVRVETPLLCRVRHAAESEEQPELLVGSAKYIDVEGDWLPMGNVNCPLRTQRCRHVMVSFHVSY